MSLELGIGIRVTATSATARLLRKTKLALARLEAHLDQPIVLLCLGRLLPRYDTTPLVIL